MAIVSTSNNPPLKFLSTTRPLPPSRTFGKKIARDTAYDPFSHRNNFLREDPYASSDFIGMMIPANDMVPREALYAAALSPKGRFISWVSVVNSFHYGWFFIQTKLEKEPLAPRLETRLWELNYQYNLKQTFIQANFLRRTFGQCLWFVREVSRVGQKSKLKIHVTPIWREDIEYDDQGNVTMFHPRLFLGNLYMRYDIKADRAVLWKNTADPFGNEEQGIPELLAVYRTILRSESIAQNFAQIVTQRGLGQLDIEIEGINTQEDAKLWAETYKGLVQDSIIVHSPDMKTSVTPGMSAGYDYDATQQSYFEDTAAGTGFPQMRMRGVQTGTVTGSETDQDNMAEIYGGIQESSEEYMKRAYVILDSMLESREFEIDWRIDIKADEQKRSAMLATNVSTVLAGSQLFTVNQAMRICGLPLIDGPDGDLLLESWIDKNFPSQMPPTAQTKASISFKEDLTEPSENPLEETGIEEPPAKGGTVQSEQVNEEIPSPEGDSEHDTKANLARVIFDKINAGVRPVNAVLKELFKSGLSHTDLVAIREKRKA